MLGDEEAQANGSVHVHELDDLSHTAVFDRNLGSISLEQQRVHTSILRKRDYKAEADPVPMQPRRFLS